MTKALTPLLALSKPALPYTPWENTGCLQTLVKQRFANKLLRKDLLQFLIAIQQQHGWIPEAVIDWCATQVSNNDAVISHEEIRGIIDFYSFLIRQPNTPFHLHLSTNITDLMLGQQANIDYFSDLQTQYPERFSVSTTSCSGLCDQGPAGLMNGLPVHVINDNVRTTIKQLVAGKLAPKDFLASLNAPDDNIKKPGNLLQYQQTEGYALKKALRLKPAAFLNEVKVSKLRGRGGAGFPTGTKWQTCQQTQNANKVVICNADEGEPGTFKDRVLLNSHLNQVLDGMTIAAYTVGATMGFIYLRFEYQYLTAPIEAAIKKRIANNLLGKNIAGVADFNFNIQLHLGAGAYVCGEETALIESLEGKRGIPRIRPPFPAESGYLNLPTIVNNVETFCCIADIAQTSGKAFSQQHCEGSTGTKIHSVSGDCKYPGIYELPFNTTVQDVLTLVGAKDSQAVQVGGPSGKLLFPHEFSSALNYSHISSGGSFMIFNQSRDLFATVKNFTDFFHHESCGFCTPCRVGCGILGDTLDKFAANRGSEDDITHLKEMMALMDVTSHCGLGQTASHPVRHLLAAKPELFNVKQSKKTVLKIDLHEITSDARALHLQNALDSDTLAGDNNDN